MTYICANRSLRLILALALAAAAPLQAAETALPQIGVAAAVMGRVMAFPPGKAIGRNVKSGKPLFLNEKITTDAKSRLQIMLLDQTIFTIGPNSAVVLDEFVYNPRTESGQVSATVSKGVFRFVTGKTGHTNPSSMKVKFPSGTMGIRGTIVAGEVDSQGRTTAVLLGPGASNNAGERVGAFQLSNAGGSVDVVKPGFGSRIDGPRALPSPPAPIPQPQLNIILGALVTEPAPTRAQQPAAQPAPSQQNQLRPAAQNAVAPAPDPDAAAPDPNAANAAPDASATDQSGQDTASAQGDLSNTASALDANSGLNGVSNTAADASAQAALLDQFYGPNSWEGIRAVTSGVGYYDGQNLPFYLLQCLGGACTKPQGTFNYHLDINFGNQTFGGPNSVASVSASDPGGASVSESLTIAQQSYSTLNGAALISGASGSGKFKIDYTLNNIAGVAALGADVAAVYDDGSTYGYGYDFAYLNFIADGAVSSWQDIIANIPSGTGSYSATDAFTLTQCQNGPCASSSGTFNFNLNMDFGAKTYSGNSSMSASYTTSLNTTGSVSDSVTIPLHSYAASAGQAILSATSSSGAYAVNISLINSGGVPAAKAQANATYSDALGNIGSGNAIATRH